ncbi:cubilin-like isoform X2 [Parasteatoda tepidariorum]|uniref:cubilin-like isoform X2 n=1 Tax=Parasteatoda tepidariorum TaxID=114398 RepID=UPI0039BC45BE
MAPCNHDEVEPASAATCCVLAVIFLAVLLPHLVALECDRMFISNPEGPKNGTFTSPDMSIPEGHSRQCIYTFIASENERVRVTFGRFNLRGASPECNHEYIDLYAEIEDASMELIRTPFGGRYCGRYRPRNRISMYKTLVVAFYTDERHVTSEAFEGFYEFINASQYVLGTPSPDSVCSFTVFSDKQQTGEFKSPTYPGAYPKNLDCFYRFLGKKNERVRLEFMDFDLVFGGAHCPFDYVKVYDGITTEDPLIGTYCGQQRNLVIYSSAENVSVQFITLQRTAESENRGFSGHFEFNNSFVSLEFIGQNDGEHIRGTECDQKILSKKESSGNVYSPNYPYPYNYPSLCKYYIYGLQDNQDLERVRLEFEKFGIPKKDADCTDGGFLRIYLQGQEERQALDEFDLNLCGSETDLPPTVISEGPRLAMIFSSGQSTGQGFKARYIFETDYKVPGTPFPDGTCHFTYLSTSALKGEFNSPRYPANYPSNTSCQYIFQGEPGTQIKIVFNYFRTKTSDTASTGYNDDCTEDWLEIYEVYPNDRENKIGRYCTRSTPGPIVSDKEAHTMKVVLHTDAQGVASGFIATYNFITPDKKFDECGFNSSEGQTYGIITSPGFPERYKDRRQVCHWYISVRPSSKILLLFSFFRLEGDPTERGCPGAVVRVWKNLSQPPSEMCGMDASNGTLEILSTSSILKLSFATAEKAIGAEGFKAVWTEITETEDCDQLKCRDSGYCIAGNLRCNKEPNCGWSDRSDEEECEKLPTVNVYLIVGLTMGIAFTIFLTICLFCHRKRKRRRHHHHHPHQFPPPPFQPRQKRSPTFDPRDFGPMNFVSIDTV